MQSAVECLVQLYTKATARDVITHRNKCKISCKIHFHMAPAWQTRLDRIQTRMEWTVLNLKVLNNVHHKPIQVGWRLCGVGRHHVFVEHCLITSPRYVMGVAPVIVCYRPSIQSPHANYIISHYKLRGCICH